MTVVEVPDTRAHPAAGRRARHDLRAHRRRRRHRRARQRRASRRVAAHPRARPRREARRGTAVRRRRPAPLLRARRARRVRRRCTASRRPTGSSPRPACASRFARPTPRPTRRPCRETDHARVIAGETVRIPVPLGGADPDGDSVQLLGQESNPDRGAVVARGGDWLEYQAGEYSAGTDTFQYAVVDALGARATGSIRVGIAPRLDGARTADRRRGRRHREARTHDLGARARERLRPRRRGLALRSVEPTVSGATATIEGEPSRSRSPTTRGTTASSTRSRTRRSAAPRASSRSRPGTTRRSPGPRRPTRY